MLNKIKELLSKLLGQRAAEASIKLSDIPVMFKEALALHNIFLAFGIAEKDIHVAYRGTWFQVVVYQDIKTGSVLFDAVAKPEKETRREFTIDIAQITLSAEEFIETWNKITQLYNEATTEERLAATESTKSYEHIAAIVTHMLARGFTSDTVKTLVNKAESSDKGSVLN